MKHDMPYLSVVGEPREMKGKGAPRSTVFGVLGHTKESGKTRVLGGLVERAPSAPIPKGTVGKAHVPTERHCCGAAPKTRVPGAHHGMIPYPGLYRSELGSSL